MLCLGVLALACTNEPGDDNPGLPGDEFVTSGDCEMDLEGWSTEGSYRSLAVQGDAFLLGSTSAHVIESQEALDAFTSENELTIEAVDFSEEAILVAAVGASSTCGMSDEELVVYFKSTDVDNASIHMSLSATDTSGTCDVVCDMSWSDIRAIAVSSANLNPEPIAYSVCAELRKTCTN